MEQLISTSTPIIQQLINFYRRCYIADSRELTLYNLFSLKNERRIEIQSQDLLGSAEFSLLTLNNSEAEQLYQQVQIYQRECQLIYTCFPVAGQYIDEKSTTPQTLCAPLFYFNAHIEKSNATTEPESFCYYLSLDFTSAQPNRLLLRQLIQSPDINQAIYEFPLPYYGITANYLITLTSWLTQHTSLTDLHVLENYPQVQVLSGLRKYTSQKSLSLLNSNTLILAERGSGSRGIIHDLEQMQKCTDFSLSLQTLFTSSPLQSEKSVSSILHNLPVNLSPAQQQALNNANTYPLSFISGPPGTGKSFTIAAIAAERLFQGESVLLVGRTEQAVMVLAEKLKKEFGLTQGVILAEQNNMLRNLVNELDQLLTEGLTHLDYPKLYHQQQLKLIALQKKIDALLDKIDYQLHSHLRVGTLLKQQQNNQLNLLERWLLPWHRKRLRSSSPLWSLLESLHTCLLERHQLNQECLTLLHRSRLYHLLQTDRKTLLNFRKAIRAKTSARQQQLFTDLNLPQLLHAFPIWLVSLDTLHRVLPLIPNLFKLMVLDEATQCDIASALPAFQRAQRAVIVGDAKQLRHLSFLSKTLEQQLMLQTGINQLDSAEWSYRENSILDLVDHHLTTQHAVVMLDEHYRGHADLIAFSNKHFYFNKLKTMKHRPENATSGITIEFFTTQRHPQGYNQLEANRVIELVQQYLEHYQSAQIKPSIGILSPFRAQVEYLQQQAEKVLPITAFTEHQLRIATPYGFQGEERDIMLLSFVVTHEDKRAITYLNRPDVFNVAITRAKSQQVILSSCQPEYLPINHLLRQYLQAHLPQDTPLNLIRTIDYDQFLQEICQELKRLNIKFWPNCMLAGQLVDLLCQTQQQLWVIDLIGYPGAFQAAYQKESYQRLWRAGYTVLPISYATWKENKEACIAKFHQYSTV